MTVLSPASEEALDRIAQLSSRSREELATDALQRYAVWLEEETAIVQRARADFAAGRYQEHDEFFDELERELAE